MTSTPNFDKTLAAVDLGSNSFHMVVAVERQGELVLVDRLRERVGLAEGLLEDGSLNEEVSDRALNCLQRFGERLKGIPKERVRAVGTATFRDVRDGRKFLKRAQKNLGSEIETLPGKEEARLIYLGVAHSLGDDEAGRLVFDIGGGSTEIIAGRKFESRGEASISLGCIHHSRQFFGDGVLSRKAFKRAILAARLEIEPITEAFKDFVWTQCIGASGTILAVAELLRTYCDGDGTVTPAALDELIDILVEAGHVDELKLSGLAEDRYQVLAGGLAIMRALCEEFQIESMGTAPGALREGLLYDLLGRMEHEDVRDRSINALVLRFGAHTEHISRVQKTADKIFVAVRAEWGLKTRHRHILRWSIALAEIGMAVSYSGYHRHGAYLIQNADLAGFSSERQSELGELVRCHRRRTREDDFEFVETEERESLLRVATVMRIAHRLHRVRSAKKKPPFEAEASSNKLTLEFPGGWLDQNSLVQEDLTQEAQRLSVWGISLRLG